ncbi:DUF2513 domain-containing protein [Jeotgalibaca caeni]|uniref:DUF2513 domain-containing protein n=1 Tax=Jeotgalibaca caeni TaxID=3028623 RepID=UPI00237E57E1|nr:DUF2513 domain-containing protein [Jeotgalibaca caeni]MDE1548511.1 DUF2513 domain-containing protein [Jeotgalibaca caeni]
MELNKECVRDILLVIESRNDEPIFHQKFLDFPELRECSNEIKTYTANKLFEAGYINGNFDTYYDNSIYLAINSITWDGHIYLDNIRDPRIWDKTKKAASKVVGVSLPLLGELAKGIL